MVQLLGSNEGMTGHEAPWLPYSYFVILLHLLHICIITGMFVLQLCAASSLVGFNISDFEDLKAFSAQQPADIVGNGSTPPEWRDGTFYLTPDPIATVKDRQLHNVGRLRYNQPFQFIPKGSNQVVSFSSSFTFQIQTTSVYGSCGDGLAFVITTDDQVPSNSTGRYLGLASQFHQQRRPSTAQKDQDNSSTFFAVEFDTFQNTESDINDPSASHIGIDISSLDSIAVLDTSGNNSCCLPNTTTAFQAAISQCPSCEALKNLSVNRPPDVNITHGFYPELFLYSNYTFTAWVSYNASSHHIQVWMTNYSTDIHPSTPCLSVHYDLSKIFRPLMYVAISAASGNNFQGNILYSWNFSIENATQDIDHHLGMSPYPRIGTRDPLNPTNVTHDGMIHSKVFLGVAMAPGAIVLALACLAYTIVHIKKRGAAEERKLKRLPRIETLSMQVPRYSYKRLKRAVQSFDDKGKVGVGGFSSVYKGVLADGTVVAVKRLKDGLRMEAEFTAEVQIISQIRHRNLLQLQGWCYEKGEALLVYQFMSNGSLDSYLFGRKKSSHSLNTEVRMKVLMGVAAALEYLHNGLGGCVLHRDVKAANVLLSDDFDALVGDFGLARLITHDQVVTMTAAGTPGYVAPEVIYTGKATEKADVYSFGVLALEVSCGRSALDSSLDRRLLDWVWMLHQNNNILDALDPHLSSCIQSTKERVQYEKDNNVTDVRKGMRIDVEKKWRCVLHLGLICCHPSSEARPNMRQVYQVLQESTILPLPPCRPMYPTSYDLGNIASSLSSTFSLDHSAPSNSAIQSSNSLAME